MSKQDVWHNCYDDSWKGHIVPEAFAHPAKMAYGLTQRIFKHALSEGWIKPGDTVVDPFGGIGSTGIVGAHFGLQVVCVELEQKFVDLAKQNFELHRKAIDTFAHFGKPLHPVILQGDSRQLSEIIGQLAPQGAECLIASPPYAESMGHGGQPTRGAGRSDDRNLDAMQNGYGNSPGNIANLPPGDVAAIISSPPWENNSEGVCRADKFSDPKKSARMLMHKGHGASYEATLRKMNRQNGGAKYGESAGQLGREQGDTFWQAAKVIVEQCFQILRPGGHAIWVVKSFVRNKAIVDFPGDWRRLCEAVGFETLHEHHASLVKEDVKDSLFGGTITKRKERKSFFRRLAEAKGSPRIDYEVILCMRK